MLSSHGVFSKWLIVIFWLEDSILFWVSWVTQQKCKPHEALHHFFTSKSAFNVFHDAKRGWKGGFRWVEIWKTKKWLVKVNLILVMRVWDKRESGLFYKNEKRVLKFSFKWVGSSFWRWWAAGGRGGDNTRARVCVCVCVIYMALRKVTVFKKC